MKRYIWMIGLLVCSTAYADDPSIFATIDTGRKTVTTAGTRVAIASSTTPIKKALIQAERDNTGTVVVGGSSVVAALTTRQGIALSNDDAVVIQANDLANVYIDSEVNGEGVTYIAYK